MRSEQALAVLIRLIDMIQKRLIGQLWARHASNEESGGSVRWIALIRWNPAGCSAY